MSVRKRFFPIRMIRAALSALALAAPMGPNRARDSPRRLASRRQILNVNAGTGGSSAVRLTEVVVDPATRNVSLITQPIVGSGIMAATLPNAPVTEQVGNVVISTPKGDIIASSGGIVQEPLNGNNSLTPNMTLTAGTRDANGKVVYAGNIDASKSGVIGINTTLDAAGSIIGLVVARGNADISAAASVAGTFFAAGSANFSAGGSISGNVIAGQSINASSGTFNATAFSQNVTVGGAKADSALASSATASTTSQSAAQSAQEESTKQLAMANTTEEDDLKKQKGPQPTLVKRVGRVTVILPGQP